MTRRRHPPPGLMTKQPRKNLPIVGVMGSGNTAHADRAVPIGRWLAGLGVHLLTGGGGGVMMAVSQAFYETPARKGVVLGIVPSAQADARLGAKEGYPNPWVEVPIFTHLHLSGSSGTDPRSRNHINVLSSDAIIALPGGHGTSSEIRLALHYRRPIVAFLKHSDEIPNLPRGVRVRHDFEAVKKIIEGEIERCLAAS